MGILKSFFSAINNYETENQIQKTVEVSAVDKEIALVEKVTIEDMRSFPNLPYSFDSAMRKMIQPNSHPFAYIDLNEHNQSIAKCSLCFIDGMIRDSRKLSKYISSSVRIPVNDIVFKQLNASYGYTRLICSPYTPTGKESKYPVSLSFMTDLSKMDETHGEIFYLKSGEIGKAEVNIWTKGIGYFYKLKIIDGYLAISEIKSSAITDDRGLPITIYKK